MNTLKVGVLLVALTALFVGVGGLVGGPAGALIAFGLAVVMNAGSYWYSDRMVLSMYGARPLERQEAPELHGMLERLSDRAGIPTPAFYLVEDPSPNAFATGRGPGHAAVAVNTGLLQILDRREVEGVLAHEIAHIKHRDTLTMTVVATVAGAIMTLVNIGQLAMLFGGLGGSSDEEEGGEGGGANPITAMLMFLLAPIAATLIQMAISRAREFEADAEAARLTGTPDGLINALLKLEQGVMAVPSSAPPATAHLGIVNPLAGLGSSVLGLFQTHPPVPRRVENLERMRQEFLLPAA